MKYINLVYMIIFSGHNAIFSLVLQKSYRKSRKEVGAGTLKFIGGVACDNSCNRQTKLQQSSSVEYFTELALNRNVSHFHESELMKLN